MFDHLSCNRPLSANKDANARHHVTFTARDVRKKREADAKYAATYRKKKRADQSSEDAAVDAAAESAAVDAAAEKEKDQHEGRLDVNEQRCAATHICPDCESRPYSFMLPSALF